MHVGSRALHALLNATLNIIEVFLSLSLLFFNVNLFLFLFSLIHISEHGLIGTVKDYYYKFILFPCHFIKNNKAKQQDLMNLLEAMFTAVFFLWNQHCFCGAAYCGRRKNSFLLRKGCWIVLSASLCICSSKKLAFTLFKIFAMLVSPLYQPKFSKRYF